MRASNENKVQTFLKSKDPRFLNACRAVDRPYGKPGEGIPPTRRQASKWLMRKGIAYRTDMELPF